MSSKGNGAKPVNICRRVSLAEGRANAKTQETICLVCSEIAVFFLCVCVCQYHTVFVTMAL